MTTLFMMTIFSTGLGMLLVDGFMTHKDRRDRLSEQRITIRDEWRDPQDSQNDLGNWA